MAESEKTESKKPKEAALREADAAYKPISGFDKWSQLPVDDQVWNTFVESLEVERETATVESLNRATEIALRSAAVDTGAIEGLYETDRGFTYSVATQAAGWEVEFDQKGEDARELFEAQLKGFEMVLDMTTGAAQVSEMWIRQLHEVICAAQETYVVETPQGRQRHSLPKGSYKTLPNHVHTGDGTVHAYAPVHSTASEMHRFVEEISSPSFATAHPVLQAAYSHYSLVKIHPFADGNGRVARALASVYLYRSKGVPLMIYADQRPEYYKVLEAADAGLREPFADFVLDRGLDSLADVSSNLREGRIGGLNSAVKSLKNLVVGYGGLSHRELDAVATRLHHAIEKEVSELILSVSLPEVISIGVQNASGATAVQIDGFRKRIEGPTYMIIDFRSAPPATAHLQIHAEVNVAMNENQRFAFAITAPPYKLLTRLSEVHPNIADSFLTRLRTWLHPVFSELLNNLNVEALNSLRKSGYRR